MWWHASMYAVSTVCGACMQTLIYAVSMHTAASIYCMHECSRFSKPAGCSYQWKCLGNHSHTQRTYYRMSAASYSVTSMCCLPCLLPALHWHLHVFRSRKESTRYTLWWMVHEPQTTRGRPEFIARRSIHRFMTSWCKKQASLFNNVTTHTLDTHTSLRNYNVVCILTCLLFMQKHQAFEHLMCNRKTRLDFGN